MLIFGLMRISIYQDTFRKYKKNNKAPQESFLHERHSKHITEQSNMATYQTYMSSDSTSARGNGCPKVWHFSIFPFTES